MLVGEIFDVYWKTTYSAALLANRGLIFLNHGVESMTTLDDKYLLKCEPEFHCVNDWNASRIHLFCNF